MNSKRTVSKGQLKEAGLSYIEDKSPGIARQKRGRGFSFIAPDGSLIEDKKERERLLKLAVPPSYEEVWYCTDPAGHLQATGYDSQGKKQYFYHPRWEELRDKNKFFLMTKFGESLPSFRRKIVYRLKNADTGKEHLLCGIVRILDYTGMRIGNEKATLENQTFGLTTLRKKHVAMSGENLHFQYNGKGGATIECDLYDPKVADIINACLDLPGTHLFDYKDAQGSVHSIHSDDVNAFIQLHMGEEFSAKDFRTWRFSCLFLGELLKYKNKPEITLKKILDKIVEKTCNTPAILKSSYIHPGLLKLCKEGAGNHLRQSSKPYPGLRKSERYLLRYVRSHHARESIK